MLTFIKILVAVYIVAINVYSFLLMYIQKKQSQEDTATVKDSRITIAALLGGALGVYISTFILRYRRESMFLMVVMPLIAVANAFAFVWVITYSYGYYFNEPILYFTPCRFL